MMKLSITLVIGFLLGSLTFWLLSQDDPAVIPTAVQTESIRTPAPKDSARQSANHPVSFSELTHLRGDFEQTLALYRLMEVQDASGLLHLLDEAETYLQDGDFVAASGILYGRLAELDPIQAVAHVLQRPGTAQTSWMHAIFHAWARIDLEAATLAAKALDNPFKQIAGRAILRSRSDLSAVERDQLASDVSIQAPAFSSSSNFAQAWQEALVHTDANQRTQGLMQIAAMWAASDASAAMSATNRIPASGMRSAIQRQIARRWVTQDPDAAIDWILNQQRSPKQAQLLQQVFQALASQDPLSAQERAQRLAGTQRNQAMLGVLGPLAITDPQAATNWLETQEAPELRLQAVQTIAMNIARKSEAKADQWLATLAPKDAQVAESILSSMLMGRNPERAAQRIEGMDDSQRRQSAARNLVSNWAQQDVEATAAWIRRLPDDERGLLYQSLTQQWARWDPDEAHRFVQRLPNSAHQDQARLGLLGATSSIDDAERLYNDISAAEVKKQASIRLYHQFRQSHPEQAEVYRKAAGIPDSS